MTTFDAHRRGGRCLRPDLPAPDGPGLVVVPGRAYEAWGNFSDPEDA